MRLARLASILSLAYVLASHAGCGSGGGGGPRFSVPTDGSTGDLSAVGPVDLAMAAGCANRVRDGLETDVDCGGACAPCGAGKACGKASDCESRLCVNQVCGGPSCEDRMTNGAETDVDCGGGVCPACRQGQRCLNGVDCQGGTCVNQVCGAGPTCDDRSQNGAETDTDCGGGTCPACDTGKRCVLARDCLSTLCNAGTCAASSHPCRNNRIDGMETDVDCGGPCSPCLVGKACVQASDCMSGSCINRRCERPPGRFGCFTAYGCYTRCYSRACAIACAALINTPNGPNAFTSAAQCTFNGPCPGANGGVCDNDAPNYDPRTCQNCVMNQAVQRCPAQLTACFNDM